MGDLISRQAAIDAYGDWYVEEGTAEGFIGTVKQLLEGFPSAQQEIIRCRDCKHWKKTYGDESWSVGDCDVFDKKLVMCKGFCAWAERRTDATTI